MQASPFLPACPCPRHGLSKTEGLLFKTHPGGVRQQNETVPLTAEECLVTFSTSVCSLLRNWQISTTSLEQTGNHYLHHLPSAPPSSGPSSLSVLECGLHASPRLLECCSVAPPACLSAQHFLFPQGLAMPTASRQEQCSVPASPRHRLPHRLFLAAC